MSSRLNHYVTQYYLRSWCREPEREIIPAFLRKADGSVIRKEIAPQVTGAEINLYSFTGVPPHLAHYLEEKFFTPHVDEPGHRALRKMIDQGLNSLTVEERFAWAVYLLASNYRQPSTVKHARELGVEVLLAELSRDPQEYEALRQSDDPLTLVEFVAKHAPVIQPNAGLMALPAAILNSEALRAIQGMAWILGDMSSAKFPLLTSDNPMWANAPLNDPHCLLTFPITPTKLFMATRKENVSWITSEPPERIAVLSNRSQCMGAKRWVYGVARLRFVQKYMGG